MSNHPSAPHTDRPHTDRPTGTYPTGTYPTGRPAHPSHAAPFAGWRDRTPTEELPLAAPSRPGPTEQAPSQQAEQETPLQDMGRPGILRRPSMRWHPSLMQLAIGAALVAALLGACNVAAINAHRTARAYCHALAAQDWNQAQRECRGTGAGTSTPEQAGTPYPSATPSHPTTPASPEGCTLTRVTTPSPITSAHSPAPASAPAPGWVTSDTCAPYSKNDPSASPLDLPRCTTAPDTPMPCLAHASSDARHAVVLEEDGSMTGLVRR